ncbi:M14 family zinc carboxypeptidase [Bacteroidota bacterium]
MKKTSYLIYLIIILLSCSSIYGQESKQKLYRIHVKDFEKIRTIEENGISVYNVSPAKFIEVLAEPEQIKNLEIEDIANSFKELLSEQLKSVDLAQYHDHAATVAELISIAENNPNITKLDTIGYSVLGRVILCLKISDNPDYDEDETPIFIVGNHHGNEILSVEATLYQINYLIDNYGTDIEVTDWINNKEIWFVPLLNADGNEAMRRTNENGVDLNRNYSFGFTATGNHGPQGFSEPETQTIRDFTALYPPVMSLTYHTSGRYLLYPWTHTDEAAPDSAALIYVGNKVSESVTFPSGGSTDHYELVQGGRWYFTAGEYCDYMYVTHNTLAYTFEMYTSQAPPADVIPAVVERNLNGLITLLQQSDKAGLTGLITDATTGLPVEATIEVPIIYDQGKLPLRKAEGQYGRYYRYLEPGTYSFKISADGYRTQIFDVEIYADSLTTKNILMDPSSYIVVDDVEINDNGHSGIIGNGNGLVNINETAGMFLSLKNLGTVDANNIYAKISFLSSYNPFTDAYATILSDSVYFGDIEAGAFPAILSPDTVLFYIDPSCPDGEELIFEVNISDITGFGWQDQVSLEVHAPVLEVNYINVNDSNGNNNNILEGGETAIIEVNVINNGRQEINLLSASLFSTDNYIQIEPVGSLISNLDIQHDSSLFFEVELSANTPAAYIIDYIVQITSEEQYSAELSFQLNNINGFFDDFESESSNWTHDTYGTTSNSHDDWQIGRPVGKSDDPSYAFSGVKCWGNDMGWDDFDGSSWNGSYQHNVYAYLNSPEIDCSDLTNVGLKYMRWLTTRIGDYGRIKVNDHLVWSSTVGGVTDSEWTEHVIDISDLADNNPSVTITFEIQTNSSSYTGGWNIDDVMIVDGLGGSQLIETDNISSKYTLNNYPNPFNSSTTISYYIPENGFVNIDVFDAFGRKVKTLVSENKITGNHQIAWDGSSDNGQSLAQGIYFYQLKAEEITLTNRMVIVK